MNVRACRYSIVAILSGVVTVSVGARAGAQAPAPSGVVTNRQGLDVNGKAARRYPIVAMSAATKARVRELIAAHHPDALGNSSAIGELTFVLGPKQTYMSSTARAPSSAPTRAQANGVVAFLPSEPRSVEYTTFAAGEVGPKPLRVVVVNVR